MAKTAFTFNSKIAKAFRKNSRKKFRVYKKNLNESREDILKEKFFKNTLLLQS